MVYPLGYFDFLSLMSNTRMVLTDSGGIQEETTMLGVPCLTLRESTERPVRIEQGTNRLVGIRPDQIIEMGLKLLNAGITKGKIPELLNGQAGVRIAQILKDQIIGA